MLSCTTYNAYISFLSTPLAQPNKTKLTSVADVVVLVLLTTARRLGGGGYEAECRRGGLEGNVEGVDLRNFSMMLVLVETSCQFRVSIVELAVYERPVRFGW
jgi:hypothetical protein